MRFLKSCGGGCESLFMSQNLHPNGVVDHNVRHGDGEIWHVERSQKQTRPI